VQKEAADTADERNQAAMDSLIFNEWPGARGHRAILGQTLEDHRQVVGGNLRD
jgi:hypothetical protein